MKKTETQDEKIARFFRTVKECGGIEAFEAMQKATNPNFYQSGPNEMPDLKQISKTRQT